MSRIGKRPIPVPAGVNISINGNHVSVKGPKGELSQDVDYGVPWVDRRYHWTLGLAPDVPLDLRFDTGASRSVLDLRGLLVRRLELHTGASDTRLSVPVGAGATSIKAETGAPFVKRSEGVTDIYEGLPPCE